MKPRITYLGCWSTFVTLSVNSATYSRTINPVVAGLCALCVLCGLSGYLWLNTTFADGIKSQHQEITVNDEIDEVIISDINNDKISELIIQTNRQLAIYQILNNSYQITKTITLPADIFIYDVADALYAITPEGLVRADWNTPDRCASPPVSVPERGNGDKFTSVLAITTIFSGQPDAPVYKKFIYPDLGIFIPTRDNFSIAQRSGDKPSIIARIPISLQTVVSYNAGSIFEPLSVRTSVPQLCFADMTGDGKSDAVIITGNELRYYTAPIEKSAETKISLTNLPESDGVNSSLTLAGPTLGDINTDGRADIVVADGGEGTVYIYLAPEFQTPAQIIRTGNWIVEHNLIDLNKDGLQDLVLVQMKKLGVMGGLQAYLAHSMDWEMVVYLRKKDGYPKSPDYVREFNVPFTLNISGSGNITGGGRNKRIAYNFQTPYLWEFSGDYNGDGIRDLLLTTPDSRIQLYPGIAGRAFDKTPMQELELASLKAGFKLIGMPQGKPIVNDLNNDGKSDIIIQTVNPENTTKNKLEIFFSLP